MLVTVVVYCTTDPGVVVAEPAATVMVRPGTSTVTTAVQAAGAVPEAGQVLPGVVEVIVSVSVLFPVSGSFTVTVKRMMADCPLIQVAGPRSVGPGERDEALAGIGVVVVGGVVEDVR